MIKNRIALDEYIHSRFLYERILVDRYGSTDKYLSYYAEEKSDDTFRGYIGSQKVNGLYLVDILHFLNT